MNKIFDLAERTIVITGGLGQLGRCFASSLLDLGARVAVLDVAVEKERVNGKHILLKADVTDRASMEQALERITETFGVPSGLVNNAALDSPPGAAAEENGPFETYREESWDRIMEVNSKGTFLACQVFGGAMALSGRGSIVNISSTYGLVSPDQSIYEYRRQRGETFFKPVAYSASKSSLLNLTRYLATYWGDKAVRVNTLTLGGVFNNQDEAFLKQYVARTPLGRMADPEDYVGALVFLLSDSSSYMTGANLVMDGGWTAL